MSALGDAFVRGGAWLLGPPQSGEPPSEFRQRQACMTNCLFCLTYGLLFVVDDLATTAGPRLIATLAVQAFATFLFVVFRRGHHHQVATGVLLTTSMVVAALVSWLYNNRIAFLPAGAALLMIGAFGEMDVRWLRGLAVLHVAGMAFVASNVSFGYFPSEGSASQRTFGNTITPGVSIFLAATLHGLIAVVACYTVHRVVWTLVEQDSRMASVVQATAHFAAAIAGYDTAGATTIIEDFSEDLDEAIVLSFTAIVDNLEQYRSYIPAPLLQTAAGAATSSDDASSGDGDGECVALELWGRSDGAAYPIRATGSPGAGATPCVGGMGVAAMSLSAGPNAFAHTVPVAPQNRSPVFIGIAAGEGLPPPFGTHTGNPLLPSCAAAGPSPHRRGSRTSGGDVLDATSRSHNSNNNNNNGGGGGVQGQGSGSFAAPALYDASDIPTFAIPFSDPGFVRAPMAVALVRLEALPVAQRASRDVSAALNDALSIVGGLAAAYGGFVLGLNGATVTVAWGIGTRLPRSLAGSLCAFALALRFAFQRSDGGDPMDSTSTASAIVGFFGGSGAGPTGVTAGSSVVAAAAHGPPLPTLRPSAPPTPFVVGGGGGGGAAPPSHNSSIVGSAHGPNASPRVPTLSAHRAPTRSAAAVVSAAVAAAARGHATPSERVRDASAPCTVSCAIALGEGFHGTAGDSTRRHLCVVGPFPPSQPSTSTSTPFPAAPLVTANARGVHSTTTTATTTTTVVGAPPGAVLARTPAAAPRARSPVAGTAAASDAAAAEPSDAGFPASSAGRASPPTPLALLFECARLHNAIVVSKEVARAVQGSYHVRAIDAVRWAGPASLPTRAAARRSLPAAVPPDTGASPRDGAGPPGGGGAATVAPPAAPPPVVMAFEVVAPVAGAGAAAAADDQEWMYTLQDGAGVASPFAVCDAMTEALEKYVAGNHDAGDAALDRLRLQHRRDRRLLVLKAAVAQGWRPNTPKEPYARKFGWSAR